MCKSESFSIRLPEDLSGFVKEAVRTGQYATVEALFESAVRFLQRRDELEKQSLDHMRALIQEGIDSGPGREIDFEALKAEMYAEYVRRTDARRHVA